MDPPLTQLTLGKKGKGLSSVLISQQGKAHKRRKLNEGQFDHPHVQRATEQQIFAAQHQQQEDLESQEVGDFVYGQPGNTPQQTFFQKFGSKKRSRTMPASFFNFG
jgi:hypothetical protein